MREVPKRPLAFAGFINSEQFYVVLRDDGQECVIRAPRHDAFQAHLAAAQQRDKSIERQVFGVGGWDVYGADFTAATAPALCHRTIASVRSVSGKNALRDRWGCRTIRTADAHPIRRPARARPAHALVRATSRSVPPSACRDRYLRSPALRRRR